MTKTVVFKYTRDFNRHDIVEEFEFEDDVIEVEITEEYINWMCSLVSDSCTWYEKE